MKTASVQLVLLAVFAVATTLITTENADGAPGEGLQNGGAPISRTVLSEGDTKESVQKNLLRETSSPLIDRRHRRSAPPRGYGSGGGFSTGGGHRPGETHVMEQGIQLYENMFVDYDVKWITANKASHFGRASGGVVMGIRRGLGNVNFVRIDGLDLIAIRSEGYVLHLVPIYLNCDHWEEDFGEVSDFITDHMEMNLILAGDCNVRVAAEQDLRDLDGADLGCFSLTRSSRDSVLNTRGSKFLDFCADNGLVILNGRSKSDSSGSFTFVSRQGASVNDLVCVSLSALSSIVDFEVRSETFSDHMPIVFDVKSVAAADNSTSLLPRLRWLPKQAREYRQGLRELANDLVDFDDLDGVTSKIVNGIRELSAPRRGSTLVKKQLWFDWECEKSRRRLMKLLGLWRKSESEEVRNALDVLIDMNSDADISVDIFIEPPNPAELSDDDSGNEENEIRELSGICHVIDC
ncbi:hypothetical protein GE061_013076 [Apolygus lucorum]|uniref:Endonuclease/exonuclease/phosphatase domain-containing protein n=1 Tax=Apolygus lucorum TaxID=248454 RepID=A0A8S9XW54_APOLU|nr:hypothetical protein GE061_013076 [Apolygus lucorum]